MKLRWFLLPLGLIAFLTSSATRAADYTEASSGDLSNNGLAPTSLSFEPGSNQVIGTTGRSLLTGVDRDYFTFVVPAGYVWSAVIELPNTVVGGSMSFFGVQAGNQVTVSPYAADATGLLGWTHFTGGQAGTDLLPLIGTGGLGSTGFTPPLPAGTYAIWVQDFNTGTATYGFDLQITPGSVPEPGIAALALAGLVAVFSRRSRRSRRILTR
jgi:MYXO-CTERM domain-containing protein